MNLIRLESKVFFVESLSSWCHVEVSKSTNKIYTKKYFGSEKNFGSEIDFRSGKKIWVHNNCGSIEKFMVGIKYWVRKYFGS